MGRGGLEALPPVALPSASWSWAAKHAGDSLLWGEALLHQRASEQRRQAHSKCDVRHAQSSQDPSTHTHASGAGAERVCCEQARRPWPPKTFFPQGRKEEESARRTGATGVVVGVVVVNRTAAKGEASLAPAMHQNSSGTGGGATEEFPPLGSNHQSPRGCRSEREASLGLPWRRTGPARKGPCLARAPLIASCTSPYQ